MNFQVVWVSKNLESHDKTAASCCLPVVLGAFETAGAVEVGRAAALKTRGDGEIFVKIK